MVLTATVFLGQLLIVLMRYLLGFGFLEIQDAVNYAFASLVALSVIVAFDGEITCVLMSFAKNGTTPSIDA